MSLLNPGLPSRMRSHSRQRATRVALAMACAALYATGTASASDPVAAGLVSALTIRGQYVVFELISSGLNACAPCPPDPSGFGGGSFCWIPTTQTVQIAMLLAAKAQGIQVSGRVSGVTTDCALYQMTVADN